MVKLIKSGDRQAFNLLVTEYQQRVINISYSMLSDREEAYDAAQEVFVKIYRYIGNFRGDSSLSTWIYRITKNVCSDFLRKRREAVISLDEEDEKKIEIGDTSYFPEKHSERAEMLRVLKNAMERLDENSRMVITLYETEDLSYDEISDILNLPVGTVKSRLNRAREKLKNILSENRELFL